MDLVTGVAKDVVTGAVGSLISKLGGLLKEEYKLQKRAPEKLLSLIKELECAHAALRKFNGVPPDQLEEQVRIWAREIRDASYDMEDEIDSFLMEGDDRHDEHSAGQEGLFQRLQDYAGGLFGVMRNLFKRRKFSITVDEMNKRLDEVTQRYGRYTVDSISVATSAATSGVDPRLGAMYKEVTELVGIGKSSSDLIDMLKKKQMVSIVGVGGLGKTTLAKSVYDKLRVDFECSAFVPVGRNPDLKKVFRDILIDIDKSKYMDPKMTMLDERQLINELRENLGNKRYLLGIDDVWELETWEIIKLALDRKDNGSRVITTTRIWKVAKGAGEVYKLEHLPYDKSKKLFYTRIFGADGKCPYNELGELSEKILKKCDGVPLAIITMASLLVGKSREEWTEVCRSITFHEKDNKQVSDMEWILSLSYYDLPPHLRTCLLYLSIYPEDHFIRKDSLIWMWLAEGFVHNNKPGAWLFEVGNGYFNELINRSMIQAVEYDEGGGLVAGCRVHDMVLDLLCLKSREDNFVTVLSSNNAEGTPSSSRVRRITHQNQNTMVDHTQMDLGHVRSFVTFRCSIDERFSFQSFKLLRVLVLEHCTLGGDKRCTHICLKHLKNLLLLRYLGLRYMVIHEIPEEIGALNLLQTLDLEGTRVEKEKLPSSIGLLTQLICLRASYMMPPNGVIEMLRSLEQLEIRALNNIAGHFVKELGKLRELRVLVATLGLLNHSVEKDLVESLGNLHKIQHLQLKYATDEKDLVESLDLHKIQHLQLKYATDKSNWDTVALPRSLGHLIVPNTHFTELPLSISTAGLPNLTHLDLFLEYMGDQHLKILGLLPELSRLDLRIRSPKNACSSAITDGCFRKLRFLWLTCSAVQFVLNTDVTILFLLNEGSSVSSTVGSSMAKSVVAPVVMPNLQVLRFIVNLEGGIHKGICTNLGLDYLPSLQRVEVTMHCYGCAADEVEREKAALRKAIECHPNRPMLQIPEGS